MTLPSPNTQYPDDIMAAIYGRMIENGEFTFMSLHARLPDEAYRLADKTLQRFRRRGFASFRRSGRDCIWSLTDEGRTFVASVIRAPKGAE